MWIPIRFERLKVHRCNALGPFKEFTAFVVACEGELERLYPFRADRPRFDLRREFLIEVYRGEFPTGGYQVRVASIEQEERTVSVTVVLRNPKPGEMVTMVFTHPFDVVKIRRTSLVQRGNLLFRFTDERGNPLYAVRAEVSIE